MPAGESVSFHASVPLTPLVVSFPENVPVPFEPVAFPETVYEACAVVACERIANADDTATANRAPTATSVTTIRLLRDTDPSCLGYDSQKTKMVSEREAPADDESPAGAN